MMKLWLKVRPSRWCNCSKSHCWDCWSEARKVSFEIKVSEDITATIEPDNNDKIWKTHNNGEIFLPAAGAEKLFEQLLLDLSCFLPIFLPKNLWIRWRLHTTTLPSLHLSSLSPLFVLLQSLFPQFLLINFFWIIFLSLKYQRSFKQWSATNKTTSQLQSFIIINITLDRVQPSDDQFSGVSESCDRRKLSVCAWELPPAPPWLIHFKLDFDLVWN